MARVQRVRVAVRSARARRLPRHSWGGVVAASRVYASMRRAAWWYQLPDGALRARRPLHSSPSRPACRRFGCGRPVAKRDDELFGVTLGAPERGTTGGQIASDLDFFLPRPGRSLSDDAPHGVRRDPRTGREGRLTCGFVFGWGARPVSLRGAVRADGSVFESPLTCGFLSEACGSARAPEVFRGSLTLGSCSRRTVSAAAARWRATIPAHLPGVGAVARPRL